MRLGSLLLALLLGLPVPRGSAPALIDQQLGWRRYRDFFADADTRDPKTPPASTAKRLICSGNQTNTNPQPQMNH